MARTSSNIQMAELILISCISAYRKTIHRSLDGGGQYQGSMSIPLVLIRARLVSKVTLVQNYEADTIQLLETACAGQEVLTFLY